MIIKTMKSFILIFVVGCVAILLAGCNENIDRSNNFDDLPEYKWNASSGKANEGRCHEVSTDGTLGKFVKSEFCGH